MSLRSTLIASIVMVAVVTLLFGAAISYWSALSKVREEMDAAIAVGSRIAANAVDDAEESLDPSRRLHLLVADFDGDRHLRATWLDSAGRTIAKSTPATSGKSVPEWFQDIIRQPERTVRVKLPTVFDGLGSFVLQTDSRNEIGEVWDQLFNTLAILGLLCSLVLGCVYWLLGRALRPLDRLAESFNQIFKSEDTPRIPETGPAELVKVYRGFNEMAERLSKMEVKNRRLTEQIATVQEEERADLARDLHDEIGPFLFSVDVDAASIARCVDEGKHADIPSRVLTIRESIGHMQRHVKELLGRLRSAALIDVGLVDAIDNLMSFWRNRYPAVSFEVSVPDCSFGEEIDQTIFRIIQESLNNAMRHGNPDKVEVEVVDSPGGISITVRDDGRGLVDANDTPGFGIAGMRERVAGFNGSLEVRQRSDKNGVVVSAWLPLAASLEKESNELDKKRERPVLHEQA